MKKFLVLIALVLSFALAACAPPAAPTAAPATAPATAAPTATPATAAPTTASFSTGVFSRSDDESRRLQFNQDGTFAALSGTTELASGTYSVKGDVFTEESNDQSCPTSKHYKYTFDGVNLKFQPVEDPAKDPCPGRRDDFNATRTWVLTPKATDASAQPAEASAIPEIKVEAVDYSFKAPESATAGWTRVTLTNSGTEPHHVQFLRLNDGVTLQQFEDALNKAEGPALAMTTLVGGVGAVHPGGTASSVIDLPAGEYAIVCFITSPSDNMAHHAKGMIKGLTVKAGDGAVAAEPKSDLSVHLKDYTFEMPDKLPAGRVTIQVVNDGPELHEFNILQLQDGKTADDVTKFLGGAGGPPPFAPVGGMNGLAVGAKGYAELNLAPGKYVAICNIPSPKAQGHPHFMLGMVKEFTVS